MWGRWLGVAGPLVAGWALVAACSAGESGGGPMATGPVAAEQYPALIADAECGLSERCRCGAAAECRPFREQHARGLYAYLVGEVGLTYDATCAGRNIDQERARATSSARGA